jgi:hypothetical protein
MGRWGAHIRLAIVSVQSLQHSCLELAQNVLERVQSLILAPEVHMQHSSTRQDTVLRWQKRNHSRINLIKAPKCSSCPGWKKCCVQSTKIAALATCQRSLRPSNDPKRQTARVIHIGQIGTRFVRYYDQVKSTTRLHKNWNLPRSDLGQNQTRIGFKIQRQAHNPSAGPWSRHAASSQAFRSCVSRHLTQQWYTHHPPPPLQVQPPQATNLKYTRPHETMPLPCSLRR